MKEKLIQYWQKALQYWKNITKTQKIIFISSVAFTLLAIVFLIVNFSKTEYSQAFADLNSSDAAAITQYLDEQGISYKLSADGKSIGVPSKDATQVKINVESQGLMKNGSIGYGIFRDNISSMGMTDNEFNVIEVDAKAGEIQQLLNAMNGVRESKVLINLPKEGVFLRTEEEHSSVSVVIGFKVAYRPTQAQIDTMYNLVAHSMPKLPIENITISDEEGELLPSSKTSGIDQSATVVEQQFSIKKRFESEIQKTVYQVLGTVFGQDKVVVSVLSSLNFDKKSSQEQLVKPIDTENNLGIPVSSETITRNLTSDGSSAGGVAGTGENDIPGYPTSAGTGSMESEELEERVNYEFDRISNQIESSPFSVKDLTINVAIEPASGAGEESEVELQQTTDMVQRLLMNVVGATLADSGQSLTDEDLQKKVLVFTHTFDGVQPSSSQTLLSNPWVYGVGVAALLIGLLAGLLLYRRRRKAQLEAEQILEPVKVETPTIDIEMMANESQIRKQLESLARRKPEDFVNLLRTWLVDE